MSNLNRETLVDRVSDVLPNVTKKNIRAVVGALFNVVTEAMSNKETVIVTGFGKFTPRVRAASTARNPQTGTPIAVPEKTVVSFKSGKSLKDRLNNTVG